ncbi:MAG: TniQ family protein [Nitrospira sp.]|nr:TniQ family protein [Nitrospira sp.]
MRTPVQPLLIRPCPESVGTLGVESLSGYCQRLAADNCLPVSSLLALVVGCEGASVRNIRGIRRLTHPDLYCEPLLPLTRLAGLPPITVEALTCLPLMRTLYGSRPLSEHSLRMCLLPPYGLHTFAPLRRFCPFCLLDRPWFPLLWQFTEIRACLRHECWLLERCSGCRHPSPLLKGNSVLGRCYVCTRQLARSTSRSITRRERRGQEQLHRDYAWLMTQQDECLGAVDTREPWWARRLSYVRHKERLGIKALAKQLKVSPSTVMAIEAGNQLVSLAVILKSARFLTGSLEQLSTVVVPSGWAPPLYEPVGKPCVNPGCGFYQRSTSVVMGRTFYQCGHCGCRFGRARPHRVHGLPANTVWQAVHDFLRRLGTSQTWRDAYIQAGLPIVGRSKVLGWLARAGLVRKTSECWRLVRRHPDRLFGFPYSPVLALQLCERARAKRVQVHHKTMHRALRLLRGSKKRITIVRLAQKANMSPSGLAYRIRHYGK